MAFSKQEYWSGVPLSSPLKALRKMKSLSYLGLQRFFLDATAIAKSLQSCLTLCDPRNGSPPGFPVPGTLQARTLEGVAISFSNAWKWKVKVKLLSRVRLLGTPWTAAYQASLSMGFSRQEYCSGMPLPSAFSCIGSNKIKSWKPGRILYVNRIGEQMVHCVERKNMSKAKHWSCLWEKCQVDLLVLESGRRVEKVMITMWKTLSVN